MSTWIPIGRLEDIPPLGARTVNTEEGDIAVFRTQDDQLFALFDRCPHKGGPLSMGIVHGKSVTCPLHNWVLDLEQGCAKAPDEGCVRHYPVKLEDGQVFLSLEKND
jgi:nitrite reductase (NADH) small subunit